MHTLEILEAGKTIEIPSNWDECNHDQAAYIAREAFEVISGKQPIEDFQRKVFCRLTGLEMDIRTAYKQRMKLNDRQNEMLCILAEKLCRWPFKEIHTEDGDISLEFSYNTVINHFPLLRIGSHKLYGPEDLLQDITFAEFEWANNHSQDYFQAVREDQFDQAEESLDYFLACLYRTGSDGKRGLFVADEVFENSDLVEKVPFWQKNCILLWYTMCINVIQTIPLKIQGVEIDLSVLFPEPSEAEKEGLEVKKQGIGWRGALYDIAASGVFGPIEKTETTPLFTILVYMYKKHIDYLRSTPNEN
jgi:hypothetical protein